MKLHFLGGADEVGASCTLIEIEGHRLLVDAGIRMGAPAGGQLPNFSLLDDVGTPDEVLLTHAHSDHTGALPVLVSGLPSAVPIRTTAPTRAIAQVLLQDALKIMEMRQERESEIPLYSLEAVEACLARMTGVPYMAPVPLCNGALKATWTPSGHILGAASVYIEGRRESLLMSGDVSLARQQTIPGMVIPQGQPDVLVLESTYGNRRHADRPQQEKSLAQRVAAVVAEGGKVLVPAFAVGRAQEVLLILAGAMRRGDIPAFPVYVDGMVRAVNAVYSSFPDSLNPSLRRRISRGESIFYQDHITPVRNPEMRDQIIGGPPCCIVASSGMLSGGASMYYAERFVDGSENLIAITGYQDEESPGRALLDLAHATDASERVLTLNGQRRTVRCRVEPYSLSAHADAGELAGLVQRLKPQAVCLVHGDGEARRALSSSLDMYLPAGVHLPISGGSFRLDLGGEARRQRLVRHGIGGGEPMDGVALERVATYLRETDWQGVLRLQDVAEVWYGTHETTLERLEDCKEELNEATTSFVADLQRPYLFRLVEAAEEPATGGALEMNLARERITQAFPAQTGFFKCSVHTQNQTMELAFHFPEIARQRYADQLSRLETELGWRLTLRQTPHQDQLVAAAMRCLPQGLDLSKAPALHLDRCEVVVEIATKAAVGEETRRQAEEQFSGMTGYHLVLRFSQDATPKAMLAVPENALEINLAYAQIKEDFSDQPHTPYKMGKIDSAEGPLIELSFISPAVGRRYTERIAWLEKSIGWEVQIREAVNQQLIAQEGRRLTPARCGLVGGPRLFIAEERLVVVVRELPSLNEQQALEKEFNDATGFNIEWKVQ